MLEGYLQSASTAECALWIACALAAIAAVWRAASVVWTRRAAANAAPTAHARKLTIVFATQKGTARGFAHRVFSAVARWRAQSAKHAAYLAPPTVIDAASFDPETLNTGCDMVVFVLATYAEGGAPESAKRFHADFREMANDFRYGGGHLARQTFFTLGLGDVVYANHFNRFAKDMADWLKSLGGNQVAYRLASEKRAQPLLIRFISDVCNHLDQAFAANAPQPTATSPRGSGPKMGVSASGKPVPLESESEEGDDDGNKNEPADVEDVAGLDERQNELLFPRLRQSLEKQGYQLIGSHSGVKLCRWTKAMLRGRGGCYKHTFYNISSYQCMEMTPSLACANKCVFCWRHHTNPVSKSFTWKVDPPEFLIEQALAAHRGMIKPLKGVPGITSDRLAEAMNVRHCALSLVGEPIMYPLIGDFVDGLHRRHISSFMVTNAQFPDRLAELPPVTQLYLSIDAPTKEELRAVDRPLFDDFWERMLACIVLLRERRERTVFRLTLVEGFNTKNCLEYCRLIELGRPDFIEIKGVTFCGDSAASPITMQHVPFHSEVVAFCKRVVATLRERAAAGQTEDFGNTTMAGLTPAIRLDATPAATADTNPGGRGGGGAGGTTVRHRLKQSADSAAGEPAAGGATHATPTTRRVPRRARSVAYEVACEHEHSCCVLIAHERFRATDGASASWRTWIDYGRFFELIDSGRRDFDALDYCADTPQWATLASAERGFDPDHTRHYRNKRVVPGGGC